MLPAAPPPASKLPLVGTTIFSEMTLLAQQYGAVNLGQGFPDFGPPPELTEALAKAVRDGLNQYAPMPGLPRLREEIARLAHRRFGAAVDPGAEVTITSGGTEALFAAIAAVVDRGDEVILLDPCYDCYDPAVRLQGGVPVHVPLDPATFLPDWERLRAALTPRTRLIVVNTPHNPAGSVFSPQDWQALADLLRDTRVLVISDEVYEHIVFDGRPHASVLGHPELRARAFAIGSFGKTYHCTGWKTGYAVAPAALSAEFRKVHQFLTFCTFHAAQAAFATMMAEHPGHHEGLAAFYQERRDAFRALLEGTRFRPLPVAGSYFQLADYSALSDAADRDFCVRLCRDHGVAAIPLSPFCEAPPSARLVRFCFAKGDATLQAAAVRLRVL
jgi:methionine aminotransferase